MIKTTERERGAGCLYVVATPIGNLEDISLRALRVLKESDAIACEDTRQTLKLISHFDIQKRLISYHEHNEITRAAEIVIELEQGAQIALVPLPGACAFVAALAASGMATEEFTFIGFLPSRPTERRKRLRALAPEPRTLALYEAPHRLQDTLEDALEILGNRPAVVARELTKVYEEFWRGHLDDLLAAARAKPPRGEITLLIGTADGEAQHTAAENAQARIPLARRVAEIMKERGVDNKAALKQVARERGLTRREAYKQLLITREE